MGSAERQVVPDRVVVSVGVQTPVLPTAQEALSAAATARRRLLDHLAAALPASTVSDGRITTRQEERMIEEEVPGRTQTRYEVAGYTGLCTIAIEGDATTAAEIVAAAGSHADAERASPRFEVGRALEQRVRDELEQEAVRNALVRAKGLAAAAGMAAGPVMSIGEHSPLPGLGRDDGPHRSDRMMLSAPMPADELEEALGELRPEPELRIQTVPVRVALEEARAT